MPYRAPDGILNFSHLTSRPEPEERLFVNETIESVIETVGSEITDDDLRRMFIQCFPSTLDTTVYYSEDDWGNPDTFIVTGDIPAMWLRDSTNQVWPYLQFASKDEDLQKYIANGN